MPSKTFQYGSFPLTEENGILVDEAHEMQGAKRALALSGVAGGRGINILRTQQLEKVIEVNGFVRETTSANFISKVRSLEQNLIAENNNGKANLQVQTEIGTYVYDDAVLLNPDTLVDKERGWHSTYIPFRAIFACPKGYARDINETIITDANITSVPKTGSVNITGNANTEPILKFTFDTASSIQEVTFTNTTTNEAITVSGITLINGDVLEIDVAKKQVRLNTVIKKFTGVFPFFIPGTNNYQITFAGASNVDEEQTSYDSERSSYGQRYVGQEYQAATGNIQQIALLLKRVSNSILSLLDDFADNNIDGTKWNTSGVVQETGGELRVIGAQMEEHDNFDDNSVNGAKWNVSGTYAEEGGRMRVGKKNGSGSNGEANTDGKTNGDPIFGAEWWFSWNAGGSEGPDVWSGIYADGSNYLEARSQHAVNTTVISGAGAFSGLGYTVSGNSATVKVTEEGGRLKLIVNGVEQSNVSGAFPAGCYFRAVSEGGSGTNFYVEVDSVQFVQSKNSVADTNGKTNGDPLGGAEWYQEHIGGTHNDGGTMFAQLTNGTDSIKLQHDITDDTIDLILAGYYGSGTVHTISAADGTFQIVQEFGNILVKRNGSTIYTITNKVIQDNTYFDARADVTTPGTDHYLKLDNVKTVLQFNQSKDLDIRLETNNAGKPSGDLLESKRSSTAQAGAASTITLDASASATDDFYNQMEIKITGGTGSGQRRIITDYVGASKVATVHKAWTTQPTSSSTFEIRSGRTSIMVSEIGTASFSEFLKSFAPVVPHTASTVYHIVVKQLDDGGDANNYILIKANTAGGYANGTVETTTDGGANWTEQTDDLYFKLWTTLPTSFNVDFELRYNPSYLAVV